jgi:hypothetical protein
MRSLTQPNAAVMREVLRAVTIGTIAVALLDATDGVVFFGLTLHFNVVQVLQYIASGALGRSAFDGGLATAFAGLLIHFGLAAVFTAIFAGAYLAIPTVRRFATASGMAYGALVWLFMNLLVLPHSGVPQMPLTTLAVVHGVIGHALFVGLPAALTARRWLPKGGS